MQFQAKSCYKKDDLVKAPMDIDDSDLDMILMEDLNEVLNHEDISDSDVDMDWLNIVK